MTVTTSTAVKTGDVWAARLYREGEPDAEPSHAVLYGVQGTPSGIEVAGTTHDGAKYQGASGGASFQGYLVDDTITVHLSTRSWAGCVPVTEIRLDGIRRIATYVPGDLAYNSVPIMLAATRRILDPAADHVWNIAIDTAVTLTSGLPSVFRYEWPGPGGLRAIYPTRLMITYRAGAGDVSAHVVMTGTLSHSPGSPVRLKNLEWVWGSLDGPGLLGSLGWTKLPAPDWVTDLVLRHSPVCTYLPSPPPVLGT